MAAPATPSRTLPKSNFHHSLGSAPADAFDRLTENRGDGPEPQQQTVFASQDFTAENLPYPQYLTPAPSYAGVDSLVIVCCHAIFHPKASSSLPLHSPLDERNWHLAPFQKSNPQTGKPGEHETFVAHALAGIDILANPSHAANTLLVLSGGVTKSSLTSLSEARSYYHAVLALELAQGHLGGGRAYELFNKARILLEEYATDSFQNLLLSILLFRRTTGAYPKRIRVITHAFKARRFLDLHAPAIRWPSSRIQVQGIDPVMSRVELKETFQGEEKHGYAPWLHDPLGRGEALSRKRMQRGWEERTAEELGDGLEESVKHLLRGTVLDNLPWIERKLPSRESTALVVGGKEPEEKRPVREEHLH